MQITKDTRTPTSVKLTIVAEPAELAAAKQTVLKELGRGLKIQGFRAGTAPLSIVERSVDQNQLQTEFMQHLVNDLYVKAIDQQRLRPVAEPQITITKFVPFSDLAVTAEVEVVGDLTLPDYTNLKIRKSPINVTDEQVDKVIKDLQGRVAKREPVKRAAKLGDEATIDFSGADAKTKQVIAGAVGSDYPLLLGSGSFIPGFEDEVVGLKVGDEKTFDITFPKDYGTADLQNKKVTFTITVKKLEAVVEPKVDAAFAAEVGPFTSVAELKKDIRRELETQAAQEADRQYENQLVEAIAKKTKVEIPTALVDEELDRLEQQERQNVVYQGQTWQEHLDSEGVTEAEHRERNREGAELRVKAGLVLGDIAEQEKITVTPEELEIRLQLLKGRYASDDKMLSELDKPENRRDVMSRLMTEKTIDRLKSLQPTS